MPQFEYTSNTINHNKCAACPAHGDGYCLRTTCVFRIRGALIKGLVQIKYVDPYARPAFAYAGIQFVTEPGKYSLERVIAVRLMFPGSRPKKPAFPGVLEKNTRVWGPREAHPPSRGASRGGGRAPRPNTPGNNARVNPRRSGVRARGGFISQTHLNNQRFQS